MKSAIWILLGSAVLMAGCKTPAEVYEEREVRNQPITAQPDGPQVIQPADVLKVPNGRTVITEGMIGEILSANVITLRTGMPTQSLLVLIPSKFSLPPGRTSLQPWQLTDRVRATGQVQTYAQAQMATGVYDLVPITTRAIYANQPILIANDVTYMNLTSDVVTESPSGEQVAKAPVSTTPPPTGKTTVNATVPQRVEVIRDVQTIVRTQQPTSLIGREVALNNAPVIEVPSDKTFWVDAGNGKRFLCIIDEVNRGSAPQEQQVRIKVGDKVNLAGKIMKADPKSLPTRDPLTAKDKQALSSVPIYVWVQRLSEKLL